MLYCINSMNIRPKVSFEDIVNQESNLVLMASKNYGSFFDNAVGMYNLLHSFIVSVPAKYFVFTYYWSVVKRSHLLALLSAFRRHYAQSKANLRQMLEAGVLAAYSLSVNDARRFLSSDGKDLSEHLEQTKNDAYNWIEQNYQISSDAIKRNKLLINKIGMHANIVEAHNSNKITERGAEMPFFDFIDRHSEKTSIWHISNMIMGIMDLIYGVNKDYNVLTISDDFEGKILALEKENDGLKKKMMQTKRYKNSDERAKRKLAMK